MRFRIATLGFSLLFIQPALAAAEDDSWKFTAAGNTRTMVESYHNLDFDLTGEGDDSWVQQRAQAKFALQYDEKFEIASELSWGDMRGRQSDLGPPDRDDGDILQLYARTRLDLEGGDTLDLKAGRQTLYYGSGRLLSTREGANQRLAHDALLLSVRRAQGTRIDAFVAAPVETEPGLFDNVSHPNQTLFWSLYMVTPSPWDKESHFDLYYIGLRDENSPFVSEGRELRHTIGVRWWDETGPWIHNIESIAQFGDADDRDILAGAISLGTGFAFEDIPMKPTLMLRADVISGGGKDGALHTLHPLFQANNYFNEGGFISPSNLYNINPVIDFKPHDNVVVSLGVNFLWRFSDDDAIYAPPLQPIGAAAPGVDPYLGTAFTAAITLQISDSTEFGLSHTHHEAGPSLTAVGGRNVDYLQTFLQFTF